MFLRIPYNIRPGILCSRALKTSKKSCKLKVQIIYKNPFDFYWNPLRQKLKAPAWGTWDASDHSYVVPNNGIATCYRRTYAVSRGDRMKNEHYNSISQDTRTPSNRLPGILRVPAMIRKWDILQLFVAPVLTRTTYNTCTSHVVKETAGTRHRLSRTCPVILLLRS